MKDMEQYECFRFQQGAAEGPAYELCQLVTRLALAALLLLELLGVVDAIVGVRIGLEIERFGLLFGGFLGGVDLLVAQKVLRKFLANNCGDFIDLEELYSKT